MSETLQRPVPAPAITIESKPFWDAARAGRFTVPRCQACRKAYWYPRAHCPFCHSSDVKLEDSPGEGVVYAFTVMRKSPTGPYALAYVTLDEGCSMLTNLVDLAAEDLKVGLRVKVRLQPTDGGPPVPVFAPL